MRLRLLQWGQGMVSGVGMDDSRKGCSLSGVIAANIKVGRLALGGLQRLLQVGEDVVDMLDADRQADQILGHPGLGQLLLVELAVGGGGRVTRSEERRV